MSSKEDKPQKDRWIKIISTDGHIRGVAVYAQGIVQHAAQIHGLSGFPADALGEALISGILMASYCKGEQRINVNIRTSGLIRQCLVDAYPDGRVRGYVTTRPPEEALQSKTQGPWGEGLLSILRASEKRGAEPYIGTVPLVTGLLAKDMSYYWLQSEQVPSAVGLCVTHAMENGAIGPSGGFLVQVMPGAPAEMVKAVEKHIEEMPSLAHKLLANENPIHILSEIFQSMPFLLLEEKELKFQCACSYDRVRNALALVGTDELKSILQEDGKASVRCDFCTKSYVVDGPELQKMLTKS